MLEGDKDRLGKEALAAEGVDYLMEQNMLLRTRVAYLIAENSLLKDKLKRVYKGIKAIVAQCKKVLVTQA